MTPPALAAWHELVRTHDPQGLDALLADDAVFHSPVVHTPQVGKAIVRQYLAAAFQVFFNESFRYTREVVGPRDAVLALERYDDRVSFDRLDRAQGQSFLMPIACMNSPNTGAVLLSQALKAALPMYVSSYMFFVA